MSDDHPEPPSTRRTPFWLRALLMLLVILAAAAAFWINNTKIIEQLQNR